MDFNVGPFDLNDDPPHAMGYMYHQEYASKKNSSDHDTISNELVEEDHHSSFRTENSKLSFEEIEKEFMTKEDQADDFDKPPADLRFDPKQMINDRERNFEEVPKDNFYYADQSENLPPQTNLKNSKKKRNRSRSGKRPSKPQNPDIEDQIRKRNEMLKNLKISKNSKNLKNLKNSFSQSKPTEVKICQNERKNKKLVDRNKALKQENIRCNF